MKKSIKKVTGWIVAICFIAGFVALRNNAGITPLASVVVGGGAQNVGNDNNGDGNSDGNDINYDNSTVTSNSNNVEDFTTPSNTNGNNNVQSTNSNPAIADLGTNDNQGTIMNNDVAYEDTRSSFEEAGSRGGPNVSEQQSSNSNASQNQSNAVTNNYSGSAGVVGSSSSSARVSVQAPSATVVTAPGGPGGGGGGGDPFVPIDDYYGLIFLLVTSTLVGVFTLRKVKTV